MIISFICWLIGMDVLKDYGWQFKEDFGVCIMFAGAIEWIMYFCIVGSFLGWVA